MCQSPSPRGMGHECFIPPRHGPTTLGDALKQAGKLTDTVLRRHRSDTYSLSSCSEQSLLHHLQNPKTQIFSETLGQPQPRLSPPACFPKKKKKQCNCFSQRRLLVKYSFFFFFLTREIIIIIITAAAAARAADRF